MNVHSHNRDHAIKVLKDSLASLSGFLDDAAVQEIMVNGPNDVWIERNGVMSKQNIQLGEDLIKGAINVMAKMAEKSVSKSDRSSILDSRMQGMRFAAALSPISVKGHSLCIRKHLQRKQTIQDYLSDGAFDIEEAIPENGTNALISRPSDDEVRKGGEGVARFIQWVVQTHSTSLISGGTSSGKTTFLNGMMMLIPHRDRVLTIEDTHEVDVHVPNFVCLEANEQKDISIRDLVRLGLRYRPDWMILGETRGGEALDLMRAANSGHAGFATLHANSAAEAMEALEIMIMTGLPAGGQLPSEAIRKRIATTFKFVFHFSKENGRRGLREIIELKGYENGRYVTNVLFRKGVCDVFEN